MLRVVGLMSGTSLDGVDAAWLETDGVGIGRAGRALTIPYPTQFRARLRRILEAAPRLASSDPELLDITAQLTEFHFRAVLALGEPADLIGFHGQTILHRPEAGRTWQIGDAALLANLTGLPVAHDFRSAYMAAGGQGAPLAPAYHAALANGLDKPVAVLNVGGVANLTLLSVGEPIAFDTGPGNALLDDWAQRHLGTPFDEDGRLASSGRPDPGLVSMLLDHPYFARPFPKSLDRLEFAVRLAESGLGRLNAADGAATLVAFTAGAIARVAQLLPERPRRWLVSGGGRHNPAILEALRDAVRDPVEPVEAVGWDGDALEAQCFAYLAARVRCGLPLTFPGTTGVPSPMPGGAIARPLGRRS
jgi:anhydro-N-acetylmuramic acid kinase